MGLTARMAVSLLLFGLFTQIMAATPAYTVEEAVSLAKKQNPDIAIARQQMEAARGGAIEARSGFLPSVVSSGFLRKRERQESSRLRNHDYNASVRVIQNVYTGGALTSQLAIARLNEERRAQEFQAVVERVAMDVRVAFYELLLNRAKIGVREQSVRVLEEELKTQRDRFAAGLVGELNVRRAEVALANERPELIEANTRLNLSFLRLNELFGGDSSPNSSPEFEAKGELRYRSHRPNLSECLAYANVHRPELKAREKSIEIEDHQILLDQSELRPRVEAFSGYELYNEIDPEVGRDLNHGYVVGLNAMWPLFDGFATKGRVKATRARREAAVYALEAARLTVASEVRSAFLDLEQAERVLETETRNVQNADEALEMAKANLGAGLGTQLEILQAATDVTRTRTTRLSAFYLHNAAMARLARACAREPAALGFQAANPTERVKRSKKSRVRRESNAPSRFSTR